MSIGAQIKHLRKLHGLTQQAFADAIDVKQTTIASYETGQVKPSSRIISAICQKFGVNQTWLLTGEGEMLRPVTRNEEIAFYMGRVLVDEDADFQRRIISAMSKIPPEIWPELERFVRRLVEDDAQKKDT